MFSASASTDPDGDPLRFYWIWVGFPPYGGSTDSLVQQGRGYPDDGVYTVTLIATDSVGASDTASTTLTVTNAPPVVTSIEPPRQQAVGIPASVRVGFSDPGYQDTHTLTIRWGDGTSDSIVADTLPWIADSIVHTYTKSGSYLVTATVRDDDGGVDSLTAPNPVFVFDAAERRTVAGYEARDLGTVGGNSALPADFNNRGQVVGSSLTADGATHAFLWDGDVMRDLGTLGYLNSEGTRINEAGLIAGAVWTGFGEDNRHSIAAIWRDGTGTILDAPGGLFVDAMNESGDILWRQPGHESGKNWLWRNGAWSDMGNWYSLKQPSNAAMNDHGQIVVRHGFRGGLWEGDSLHDIGVLSWRCAGDSLCGWSFPMDINESGQIVGTSSDTGKITRFVLWEKGEIRALALAPFAVGWTNHAYINDRGQIAASAAGEAFFWSDGNRQSLVAPGGVEVVGLNANGEVAGTFLTGTGEQHVFVWSESRGMVDLGTGPHAFSGAWAVGINDRGDVVGFAAPCEMESYGKCRYPQQVRAILWRRKT